MIALSKIENIIGVKDATNDLFRPLITQRKMNSKFCYLSGEDGTALAYLSQGGHGYQQLQMLLQNYVPIYLSWREGNIIKAQEINLKLARLHNALFLESSPGPVKYCNILGLCDYKTRLPLFEINDPTKNEVRDCLKDIDLINESYCCK